MARLLQMGRDTVRTYREALKKAGIPSMACKYSENTGQFQQFREQAGTFSDSLKLWEGGERALEVAR